jgi:curved DNA-binding protein CbpA
MKPYEKQNFYELLDVAPGADSEEIHQAYTFLKQTFSDQSSATYSMLTPEERETLLARIQEAYTVLMNEASRREYNERTGIQPPPRSEPQVEPVKPEPPPAPVPVQKAETAHASQKPVVLEVGPEGISGEVLKAHRERRSIPLQEIAAKTRINITYLQFIEANHYSGLPAEVYLRGYLAQYAWMIGLDPTAVVNGYLMTYRKHGKKPA